MGFVQSKIEVAKKRQESLLSNIRNRKMNRLTRKILRDLKPLEPFVYHVSKYDSVYIKFDKYPWSVRVGDHKGRDKYNYKVNIHTEDCDEKYWLEQNDKKRNHHFHISELESAVEFILSGQP